MYEKNENHKYRLCVGWKGRRICENLPQFRIIPILAMKFTQPTNGPAQEFTLDGERIYIGDVYSLSVIELCDTEGDCPEERDVRRLRLWMRDGK
jgi:hypothetical protein